jgi:hypothetical protein
VQSGACCHQVEEAHGLGADAALEDALTAHRVLAGDAALLVGGGAERQVGMRLGDPVPGLDTVAGREDVRQIGLHPPVDLERTVEAGLHSCLGAETRLGARADDRQHQIRRLIQAAGAEDPEPIAVLFDALDAGVGHHVDAVAAELRGYPLPQVRIQGRHDARHRLDHRHLEPAARECLRHLHADVAAADDQCALGLVLLDEAGELKGVSHPAQGEDTGQIGAGQLRLDRHRTCAEQQPVVR